MPQINRVSTTSSVSGINTSYNPAKVMPINMDMFPQSQPYEGYISLIVVQVSNISSATTLTLRLCKDSAGDSMLITDTASVISTGLTTATKGSAIFALNSYCKLGSAGDGNLFAFCKVNNGSLDVDYIEIVYEGAR